jgi:hypothetical protein
MSQIVVILCYVVKKIPLLKTVFAQLVLYLLLLLTHKYSTVTTCFNVITSSSRLFHDLIRVSVGWLNFCE